MDTSDIISIFKNAVKPQPSLLVDNQQQNIILNQMIIPSSFFDDLVHSENDLSSLQGLGFESFVLMILYLSNGNRDESLEYFIKNVPISTFHGADLAILFKSFRNSIIENILTSDSTCSDPYNFANTISDSKTSNLCISLNLHSVLFDTFSKWIQNSNPKHISLPGDKSSYIQLSSVSLQCYHAYTITMWVKIDNFQTKGFMLLRCRSPNGGIDVIFTEKNIIDGRWQVTIRSFRESIPGNSSICKEEVKGLVLITSGQWHLISIKQCQSYSKPPNISFLVDGTLEWESDLPYPFPSTPTDSQWILGLGLNGLLSSCSVYSDDIDTRLLKLLYEQGPQCANLITGIRCPQSSFDTGQSVLGSMLWKGPLAVKAARSKLAFSVDSSYFLTSCCDVPLDNKEGTWTEQTKGLPQQIFGNQNIDHIDMVSASATGGHGDGDQAILPVLIGKCKLVWTNSFAESWYNSGGGIMLLYILWGYCTILSSSTDDEHTGSACTGSTQYENTKAVVITNIKSTLRLLVEVMKSSGELRELFLQQHGFHVLGLCLSRIANKHSILDEDIVCTCLDFIYAFGQDATKGDVLRSALQGFLMDFRIWGHCANNVKTRILDAISSLTRDAGELLYRDAGVVRILDILRLHVFSSEHDEHSSIIINGQDSKVQEKQDYLSCVDAAYRLLHIVVDSAKMNRSRSNNFNEVIEELLRCLEETNSPRLAERILKITSNLRSSLPNTLNKTLNATRFCETTAVALLTKSNYTLETRKISLELILWLLLEDYCKVPPKLVEIRNSILHENLRLHGERVQHARGSRSRPPDVKRINDLTTQYKETSQGLEKAWQTMYMLGTLICKSIDCGLWQVVGMPIDHVFEVFAIEQPLGRVQAWLIIPLLPLLLQYCNLPLIQRILMSINVALKTEEFQTEAIGSFEDKIWIDAFVSLACIGESKKNSIEQSSFLLLDDFSPSTAVADLGDIEIASTCVELALDCLSTALEQKLRHHGALALKSWKMLKIVLSEKSSGAALTDFPGIEKKFMRRCFCLVLQRLAKSNEMWTSNLLQCLGNILTMADLESLCGNEVFDSTAAAQLSTSTIEPASNNTANINAYESPSLLEDDMQGQAGGGTSTPLSDQVQILFFIMDILSSMRRSIFGADLRSEVWKVTKPALRIMIGCLPIASELLSEKLTKELLLQLQYMSEQSEAGTSVRLLKDYVVFLMTMLRKSINSPSLPLRIRDSYFALAYAIVHHFMDIRFRPINSSQPSADSHLSQAFHAIDYFADVDAFTDFNSMFTKLEVKRLRSKTFSFAYNFPQDSETESIVTGSRNDQVQIQVQAPLQGGASSSKLIDMDMMDMDDLSLLSEKIDIQQGFQKISIADDLSLLPASRTASASSPTSDIGDLFDLPSFDIITPQPTSPPILPPLPPPIDTDLHNPPTSIGRRKLFVEMVNETSLKNWSKIRQGILLERIDSEKARLADRMRALGLNFQATDKFWKRLRRKYESEILMDAHLCHWKLGVSHEGYFPSRKRIVARPRFDVSPTQVGAKNLLTALHSSPPSPSLLLSIDLPKDESSDSATASRDVLDFELLTPPASPITAGVEGSDTLNHLALARVFSGSIRDVTVLLAQDNTSSSQNDEHQSDDRALSSGDDNSKLKQIVSKVSHPPGTGWGLVDADGSDEGYGVVGLALDLDMEDLSPTVPTDHPSMELLKSNSPNLLMDSAPTNSNSGGTSISNSLLDDMMGDIRLIESALSEGRFAETGPCFSGTRKIASYDNKAQQTLLQSRVIMVTASGNIWGTLCFNEKEIYFVSSLEPEDGHKDDSAAVSVSHALRMRRRRWTVSSICAIYLRRYRLRDTAIEVFFRRGKHRNFFVDFGHTKQDEKTRNEFAKVLMNHAPRSAFKQWHSIPLTRLVNEHGVQEKWLNGEMSNFDYLMALNTIAGRSFNDLCQYPVMPWIISQYTESVIDLADPNTYRDLSKPMGALNPQRLEDFLDRYNTFSENITIDIPPFMYGSHYSTMVGVVLHYLIRLEPFSSLHKEMQAGHFDVSDRLFSSIPRTFLHNTTQLSEVKELTPEWFTTPDIFRNVNNYDLGTTQDSDRVSDVELPPWAATPEEFVNINRRALESDFVSEHLHEWIDLIFGYKQQGPAAVEAHNVFFYLTYYGTVNRDMIKDDALRKATELQIAHFGQIPQQLFKSPHPQRKQRGNNSFAVPRPLWKCFATTNRYPHATENLTTDIFSSENTSSNSTVSKSNNSGNKYWTVTKTTEESLIVEALPCIMKRNNHNSIISVKYPIIQTLILPEKLINVSSTGAIEVYKYSTSDSAKNALLVYATATARANTLRKARKLKKQKDAAASRSSLSPASASAMLSDSSSSPNSTSEDDFLLDVSSSFASESKNQQSNVISFDDDLYIPVSIPAENKNIQSQSQAESSPTEDKEKDKDNELDSGENPGLFIPTSAAIKILANNEPVLDIEKDTTHYNAIPRIILSKSYSYLSTVQSLIPVHEDHHNDTVCNLVQFTFANKLLLSTGYVDGRVLVKELDKSSGLIRYASDFNQHKSQVICLASDCIPSASTDVIVSCDVSGILLVWTISRIRSSGGNSSSSSVGGGDEYGNCVISRRPQRIFRCRPCKFMSCDVSCNLGIIASSSNGFINLYSIERDEKIRSFQTIACTAVGTVIAGEGQVSSGDLSETSRTMSFAASAINACGDLEENIYVRHLKLSDEGFVAIHYTNVSCTVSHVDCYSLNGCLVSQYTTSDTVITFFDCPRRGSVVVIGCQNGAVALLSIYDLTVLFEVSPHTSAVYASVGGNDPYSSFPTPNNSDKALFQGEGSNNSNNSNNNSVQSLPESPIVNIVLGPNPLAPSLITVCTLSGEMYIIPLLDFIRWEKTRTPSALSQLVSAPIQAVKGTIQQAQNFISSTTETATAIAQNARSFADDALGELKKINRNSIFKGVGSFFGINKDSK